MSRKYINPSVIRATADLLLKFKEEHPTNHTPMGCAADRELPTERERYYQAARKLGWNVRRSKGKTYENGYLVWQ